MYQDSLAKLTTAADVLRIVFKGLVVPGRKIPNPAAQYGYSSTLAVLKFRHESKGRLCMLSVILLLKKAPHVVVAGYQVMMMRQDVGSTGFEASSRSTSFR